MRCAAPADDTNACGARMLLLLLLEVMLVLAACAWLPPAGSA
jgi:hypothetical protein